MNGFQQSVKDFHVKFGCPVAEKPTMISEKDRLRRARLIVSEAAEFVESADKSDMVGMIDSLCDIIYVVCGTAVELGIDLDPFFNEVQRSNMTKSPSKDSGGKVLKGPDYEPPDLENILSTINGWYD